MEEDFQDPEIGAAQFRSFDALRCVGKERLKSFHENEPEMHAGGVLAWSCFLPPHFKLYLDTDCIDVNILNIKQTKLT